MSQMSQASFEMMFVNLYFTVLRPSNVKPKDAVYILKDAIKAYTAVYYLGKIQSGDTVLLFNADSVSYTHNLMSKIEHNFHYFLKLFANSGF